MGGLGLRPLFITRGGFIAGLPFPRPLNCQARFLGCPPLLMRFILPTIRVSLLVSRVRVDPRRMSSPPLFTRDGERGAVDHLFQSNASTPTAWEGGNVTALRELQLVGRTRGGAAPGGRGLRGF